MVVVLADIIDGGFVEKAPTKATADVASEETPATVSEPEINENVDQERFAAFRLYVEGQIRTTLNRLQPLYKDAHESMLGKDAMMTELRMPKIVVSQFENPGDLSTLAQADFSSNTITVFLPQFKEFSDMQDSKSDKTRDELRASIETTLGHELGHMLIDRLIFDARISGRYNDRSQWPLSFVYEGSGKRMQEALAQVIGTYAHLSLEGRETDCASIAENMLGKLASSFDGCARYHKNFIDHYDAEIRDMGIDVLRDRHVKEPTDEEIKLAGLERFKETCACQTNWYLVYGLPRAGLASAMVERGSSSLASFISDALLKPESLGPAISNEIMDGDNHVERLDAELGNATLAAKNEILYKRFLAAKELPAVKRAHAASS